MMANVTTNAGRKVNEQIARYLENPIGSSKRVSAVREVDAPMAKAKKKTRSAAQKAATARMLAAAAQRRGENEELEENPKMAKKKAKKKTAKSKAKKKTAKASKKTTKRAAKKTGKSSRKKSKTRRKKPAVKWGMPAIAAAAAAPKPKKRRKKKSKTRAKAKAASKPRKKSRAKTKRTTGKSHTITLKGAPKVQYVEVVEKKRPKRRKKKALLENPSQLALLENSQSVGVFGGLFENPAGPFTKDSMMSFGWAAAGTALGFTVARLTDRGVATRKPGKSKDGTEGKHAWYGRDAAAMINRRPDAMRLGVQGVGALGAMVAAYAARNVRVLPWALGGVALGFGSNLLVLVLEWMVLPKIFKVDPKDPKTATEGLGGFGNRYLPMEQDYVQDDIDKQLEDWAALANLKAAQTGEKPSAASPLALPANMYTLGESPGGTPGPLSEAVGGLIPTGRVGDCTSCGGSSGCYSGCPEIQDCGPCANGGGSGQDDGGRNCEYTVQEGDDLIALLDATGISANDISSLNAGREAQEIWQPGNTVVLPYAACVEVVRRLPPPVRARIPEIPREPERPYEPPPPPPPVLTREPRPDRPVVTREPQPDRPVFTRANVPLPETPVFTRAKLPSSYTPQVVAGPPDNDAERERRLRGIGRDDNE